MLRNGLSVLKKDVLHPVRKMRERRGKDTSFQMLLCRNPKWSLCQGAPHLRSLWFLTLAPPESQRAFVLLPPASVLRSVQ